MKTTEKRDNLPYSTAFHTDKPLVLFGATGMLGGELAFMACIRRFSPTLVLYGSDESRLEGLRCELEDSRFEGIEVITTTRLEEAAAYGGYMFYARSVRSNTLTREEMLLKNAPEVQKTAQAIAKHADKVERLVCVTNPSDIMGLALLVYSGLPAEKVISLSALDSSRFRRVLRDKLDVPDDSITEAFTLGSHDLAMAVMLDHVRVEGLHLQDWVNDGRLKDEDLKEIEKLVVKAGSYLVKMRGHSAYQSPAWHCLMILEASDKHPYTIPTARYHHSERYPHCFFSLPCEITDEGCRQFPFESTGRDMKALDRSYQSIAELRDELIDANLLPPTDRWPDHLQAYTVEMTKA